MFVSGPFRIPAGLLVLLILCTLLFGSPVDEDPVIGSIKASAPSNRDTVKKDENARVEKVMEMSDSKGHDEIQPENAIEQSNDNFRTTKVIISEKEDTGALVTRYTWLYLFQRWILSFLLFVVSLYLIENIRDLFFPGPRRLRLDDSYLTNDPPEVGPEIALSYDTPWTLYEKLKFGFFIITGFLFLRIFLVVLFGTLATMTMSVVGWGGRTRRDNALWFMIWGNIASAFAVFAGVFAGVYHIKVFGKVADRSECKILIANHSCVMEVVILFAFANFPTFVTRKENCEKVPFFGAVAKALDAITVDRDAAESRQYTANAIKMRAKDKDPNGPQIIVFPEGTTTNQRALFLFKRGALEPGEPVQMICISFPYKYFNPCWTGRMCGGNNMIDLLLRNSSQFVTRVELRVLPVYTPTPEEKSNATLYAKHCQKMMATVLQCSTSSCTFSDYEALAKSQKSNKTTPVSSQKVKE
ncbi:putative acyltransferase [Trypanosoma theileri]|uniref:Putative acyltransferase n=1 Tax=Trypanosoma theileri TaxID=67003 RepID=A0A1X0P927_9TRYP|nr:putative acyltransferase [Trypanosoma theileri]ORC93447.1 putative acyltransferase [Trypanosoma theileri]